MPYCDKRKSNMTDLFSAYEIQVSGAKIPAYFIESTAPDDIDEPATNQTVPDKTVKIDADDAIERIVHHLIAFENPTIVVDVHGYNNPRQIILENYGKSFESVKRDAAINGHDVVCIGYRWPSEHIGAPFSTAFKAAPWFLIVLFVVGVILSAGAFLAPILPQILRITIGGLGAFALTVAFTLFLLRIVVYFRDGYRATSYGVPDLVEVIRQIDKQLADKDGRRNQVELSFIAHSMGAYVVTSVVRILSDVFTPDSIKPRLNMGVAASSKPADESAVSPNIGNVFRLMRLVLVSPDIPAEALISNRANFLAASLHRFQEAFLFSNEGDEVLRQISTTVNYFSFPTRSRKFGYRLGNVGVLVENYGISAVVDLHNLRIGYMTLRHLYDKLDKLGSVHLQDDLPKLFSYFDCTDCVDEAEPGAGMKGMLTLARPGLENKMGPLQHFRLLYLYLRKGSPNVHAGYFESPFLRQLIYRLVCIGRHNTVQAYGGQIQLNNECRQHQIKAVLKS